jgi:hypothetical protein
MVACARVLLVHVDQSSPLPHQKILRHITDYMIGELEKCGVAAFRLQIGRLASATRNLFELSFVVDYVCASDQNMDRFIVDAAIDELEIMEKFLAIDKYDANYVEDQKSQQREQHLKQQIANANLTGKGPLQAFEIAKAVNREVEYRALYKVYSKMTHASAWAILGTCSWDNMALLLLLKANGYTAECVKYIAKKTGLPADTPMPKV